MTQEGWRKKRTRSLKHLLNDPEVVDELERVTKETGTIADPETPVSEVENSEEGLREAREEMHASARRQGCTCTNPEFSLTSVPGTQVRALRMLHESGCGMEELLDNNKPPS